MSLFASTGLTKSTKCANLSVITTICHLAYDKKLASNRETDIWFLCDIIVMMFFHYIATLNINVIKPQVLVHLHHDKKREKREIFFVCTSFYKNNDIINWVYGSSVMVAWHRWMRRVWDRGVARLSCKCFTLFRLQHVSIILTFLPSFSPLPCLSLTLYYFWSTHGGLWSF